MSQKSCLSNFSYSLGKIQGWLLANAEAVDTSFQTTWRLQAWLEATTFAFSMSCESEKCNSALRHPEFFYIYIFHSLSEWTLSLKPKIFTVHFYFISVHSFYKKIKWFWLRYKIFLSYNRVIQLDKTEKTMLKYITRHNC